MKFSILTFVVNAWELKIRLSVTHHSWTIDKSNSIYISRRQAEKEDAMPVLTTYYHQYYHFFFDKSSILSLHAGTLLILLSSSTVAWFNLFIIDVQLLFLYIFCLLAILFFFIQKHNVHFLKNKSHILLRYDCFSFFYSI